MLTIAGYRDLSLIRETKTSRVYRATRERDQATFTIKTPRSSDPRRSEIAALYHEHAVLKGLDCPYVVQSQDLIHDKQAYALIQEPGQGLTLAHYLKAHPIQQIEQFYSFADQMLAAIQAIHQQRIIHRDICPDNFVIDPDTLEVKLTNFGVASKLEREVQEALTPDRLEGSLAYMAPEQTGRMNMKVDYRADYYALGVSFYEMLVDGLPFEQTDPLELIHAHLAIPAPDASLRNPQIPPSLAKIIEKLMAKNPADRYQTAAGLQHDLDKCRQQGGLFELGKADVSSRLQLSETLYGRQEELTSLLKAYKGAAEGAVEIVMVRGYSGIGKTKLINEVKKPLTEQKGFFVYGKFDQLARGTPYTAVTQALNQLARLILAEAPERFEVLKQELLDAVGNVGQVIIDLAPKMELVLGPQPAIENLSPEATRNRMMVFLRRFLRAVAGQDHPLVLVLDDLQWIDSGSLEVIKAIHNDEQLSHVLLVGSYRENEVDALHPLSEFIRGTQDSILGLRSIGLGPLTSLHFRDFLRESLPGCKNDVNSLADLVFKRSQGNPFFFRQLIEYMYRHGLLYYDAEQLTWNWKLSEISKLKMTDNVTDLLLERFQSLSEGTRRLLQVASCIGNTFSFDLLRKVIKLNPEELYQQLWPALKEELLLATSAHYKQLDALRDRRVLEAASVKATFQFSHDRMQEAAYTSLTEERKQSIHLAIATVLKEQKLAQQDLSENVFQLADHYNEAVPLLDEAARLELVALNLEAAKKSEAAHAYQSMNRYCLKGLALTAEESWSIEYDLMFRLTKTYAEALYLRGEVEESLKLSEALIERAQNPEDTAEVYHLQCRQYSFMSNPSETKRAGFLGLKTLGLNVSSNPSWFRMRLLDRQIRKMLNGKTQDELLKQLDQGPSRRWSMVLDIMNKMWLVTINDPKLDAYVTLIRMQVLLAHGVQVGSTVGLTGYCFRLIDRFHDYHSCAKLWELTEACSSRFPNEATESHKFASFNCFFGFYLYPYPKLVRSAERGYEVGIETGDLVFAGINLRCIAPSIFFAGQSVARAQEAARRFSNHCKQNGYQEGEVVSNAEDKLFTAMQNPQVNTELKPTYHGGNNLFRCTELQGLGTYYGLCDHHQQAVRYHEAWEELQVKLPRHALRTPPTQAFYALSLFHLAESATWLKKIRYQWKLRSIRNVLRWCGEANPHNYRYLHLAVSGMFYVSTGRYHRGLYEYLKALEAARESECFLWLGIIHELAAELCRRLDLDSTFRTHLKQAHRAYQEFGHAYKVESLTQRHSHLFGAHAGSSQDDDSGFTGSSQELDFLSVAKASQAISREVVIQNLLERILFITKENAGAERAVFVEREEHGDWSVLAQLHDTFELLEQPLNVYPDVPRKIINLTLRSKNVVVLDNASEDPEFESDDYVQRSQAKSVLCLPIVHQDEVIGLIYLENNLTTGSFSEQRVTVMETLAAQMAISLVNARQSAQTKRMSRAAERFVPKAVLKFLGREKFEEVALGDSVELNMNVLMSDIRGYTAIAEHMTPQESFALVNRYLEEMAPIIRKHNGFIAHYLGDGILALFPRSADDALKAAKAMAAQLNKFNVEQADRGRAPLQVGCGVHSGRVMLGTIGESERMDANVIGDAINLASRVESLNKYFGTDLLISEYSLKGIQRRERYVARIVDRVRVKGREDSVALYEIFLRDDLSAQQLRFIEDYTAAFKRYQERDFEQARVEFEHCLSQYPEDRPSQIMHERCLEYVKKPLPDDWDGSFSMRYK